MCKNFQKVNYFTSEPLVRDFAPTTPLDAALEVDLELLRKCKLSPWIKPDLTNVQSTPIVQKEKNFQVCIYIISLFVFRYFLIFKTGKTC